MKPSPSLKDIVRSNTQTATLKPNYTGITNSVHPVVAGWSYGWEVQPTGNDWFWGMRIVIPCQLPDGSVSGRFGLLPCSAGAAVGCTDFEQRYDIDKHVKPAILALQAGKPRWMPVLLTARPSVLSLMESGGNDPLLGLVMRTLNHLSEQGLKPLVGAELLLGKTGVVH